MAHEKYHTNLASEFYVMSVLSRLGLDANLTLGNQKAVDIVVARAAGDAVTIDVKAVVGKTDWLTGAAPLKPRERHFIVLLSYEGKFGDLERVPRAWIVPHAKFLPLVKASATGTMRYISRRRVIMELHNYENAWRLIDQRSE